MNRVRQLLRRWWTARRYGVRFHGLARTQLPQRLRFAGRERAFGHPENILFVADFVDVVLDDDYGLRSVRPRPRTVVDVGSNIGLFLALAREQFPDAVIHGYEPSPATAALARANTADDNVVIWEEGVAARSGRADMVDLGVSNLAQTQVSDDGAIVLTPFATVLERVGGQIDLLKVDCEGAEWDFMQGPELFDNVGCIRMEYHLTDGRTLDDLHALARGIGFKVTRLEPDQGFGVAWLDRA